MKTLGTHWKSYEMSGNLSHEILGNHMISYGNSMKSFEILCNPAEIQLKSYEIPGERSTSGERLARLEAQRERASSPGERASERAESWDLRH